MLYGIEACQRAADQYLEKKATAAGVDISEKHL